MKKTAHFDDAKQAIANRSASIDEIANEMDRRGTVIESLEAEIARLQRPFNTYPEDRLRLIALASTLQKSHTAEDGQQAANELSDLVLAILTDEACTPSPTPRTETSMTQLTTPHVLVSVDTLQELRDMLLGFDDDIAGNLMPLRENIEHARELLRIALCAPRPFEAAK